MTITASHYFVFFVLPAIFIAIWGYVLYYNHRVKARIKEIEASGQHLNSEEAGISLVTLERERAHNSKHAA
jgi:hypothetical protein